MGLRIEAQRVGWAINRLGWIVMCFAALAALAGLFGNGLLGARTISTPGRSLQLTYDRFGRYGADSTLTARLSRNALEAGEWRLSVTRKYVESMAIDEIVPEPDKTEAGDDVLVYTFVADEPADLVVTFDMTGNSVGSVAGIVKLE